ncbi:tetratricopeptide repeat protein [Pandoraea sputorum]|uniref:Ancillary SecYEG translocon subunit n=1 Tax=Pandoraea sputorum TaxID=93222 RepID=A0A5E5B5I7_9BURK|nr:tetratricopeptide repeat protein [Pandoraea sputorum]BET09340.1 tetratricopeptide repeat protein [Pandoraea sputorum]VVE79833.1 membrane protein [Pandoraea sputorum]VVE82062.1 membrane protein [Pandoraea sputorum]
MSSYHEEQEQIENVKAWWKQYGNYVIWTLVVIMLAYGGWNLWRYYERKQAVEAGVLYRELETAVDAKDKAKVARIASDMESKFSGTPYAQMTALLAAKTLADAGDTAGAKAQLQWAASNAKDDEYKQLAKLRLAGVLLDEKAYDEALKMLDNPPAPYAALFADRRGDVLVAQSKVADARTAYKLALEKLDKQDSGMRQFVQFKLDALGA